jgi:hypothetical protein
LHRLAQESPPWRSGDARADLTLGASLNFASVVPLIAAGP